MENPSERHLDAAETLLAYLLDTPTHGILYDARAENSEFHSKYSSLKDGMCAMSDSNWSSGRSISGLIILLAGGLICWASKKQPVTSLSSTEAEYYAASACGTAVLALRLFMRDIGAAQLLPTPVYVDNTACVNLAKNFKACKRTKHIDRRINFLTDYQEMGEIQVLNISTSANTADALTKPLAKMDFKKHAKILVRA